LSKILAITLDISQKASLTLYRILKKAAGRAQQPLGIPSGPSNFIAFIALITRSRESIYTIYRELMFSNFVMH